MATTDKNTESKPATLSNEERRRLYNENVRKANLVSIHLRMVNFDVDREIMETKPETSLVFGSDIERFIFNDEQGGCLISVKWRVDMKAGRKKAVKCSAIYDIAYDGLTTANEDVLRIFAENIAKSATYSYFRALFASLDWGANLRSPPLPVLKLFPKV